MGGREEAVPFPPRAGRRPGAVRRAPAERARRGTEQRAQRCRLPPWMRSGRCRERNEALPAAAPPGLCGAGCPLVQHGVLSPGHPGAAARLVPLRGESARSSTPGSSPLDVYRFSLRQTLGNFAGAIGLGQASSTRPECIIMQEIEEERSQCFADLIGDNQTSGCRRQWDNITCWPEAEVGEVVVRPCPKYFRFLTTFLGNVTRNCTSQGWTDVYPAPYAVACGYDSNSTPGEEQTAFYGTVKTGYTIGHTLSLIALTAAMIILCLFRKLHCTRNYIHMHLFMSFIMRAIAVFIKDVILFESGESEHCFVSSVGCKAMMVFFQYCVMANFFWLLVEGLYLHTLLVISFFSERKYFWWYILIGWGAPSVFITAWTVVRIYFFDVGCWEEIVESPFWWIIKTPILVSILVNFILFICIIRILVQKLHSPDVGHNETSQYSRLAKSTLLLIPLFGIHYIMFAFFPDNFKAEVKLVFELVVGSFQGFVVAVLYCFLNGEVQAELKRKWRRWHLERFLGSDMKYHHPSLGSNGTNFSTQISMLTKCSPKTRRCSGFQAEFSLV
ncbi:vasoactive intestinal polypeptide receptor 1 [Indicator indicator]|uniref:vasoactive intestinal polypeptide receptor 1 n=1 Tax=Indicator indicator TaxID=1002788 RepID=UPI0023DE9BB3|nr:vasoactive intestinal polypeptide receptor 1 [Indicator indicator]